MPVTSGLLSTLLPDFEAQTGYRVEVLISTQDINGIARTGPADLVISQYGLAGLEPFVLEDLGQWPHPYLRARPLHSVRPPIRPKSARRMLLTRFEGSR